MASKRIALSVGPLSSKQLTKIARKMSKEGGIGITAQEVLTIAAIRGMKSMSLDVLKQEMQQEYLAL
jgi:hypothetical protein